MANSSAQGHGSDGTPRRRVLVVEDDTDLARLIVRSLSDEFEVLLAFDGTEGLAMALESPHPELIITDMMMPGMDGAALTRALRAKLPSVPVIMLTAHGSSGAAVAAIQAGVRAFMHKPMNLAALKTRVRSALAPRYP